VILTKERLDAFEKRVASLIEWALSKGLLWLLMLAEIKKEPLHTYELAKRIREKYGFRPHLAAFYFTTYLMRATRLVEVKQVGSRKKKALYITPKGEEALKRGIDSIRFLYEKLTKI